MSTRYFTSNHEWLDVDDNNAALGITSQGQELLGDLVYVRPVETSLAVEAGTRITTLESVKTAYDLESPVSAVILDFNQKLQDQPELINQIPDETWIVRLSLSTQDQLGDLLDLDAYKALTGDN